jgi:transposase
MAALSQLQSKNTELVLELAKLRRERIGRQSEKLDPAQLTLLLQLCAEIEGGTGETDDEDAADEPEEAETDTAEESEPSTPRRPRRRRPRKELPRVRIDHELPKEERMCDECRIEMTVIRTEVSELLRLKPAYFEVEEHHRFLYGCPKCKEGVKTAPGPAKLIEKGLAAPSLLAHVVHSKFEDHVPLHRLSRIYGRAGADISVSTMSDWVRDVAEELRPIADRIWDQVVASHVVQADASGLKVLDRDDPAGIRKGTMWCYVGDHRNVVFRYGKTGKGEHGPWSHLAGREGYLQADASNLFDRLFNGQQASAIEVGCWAHARRRLYALKDTDPRVAYGLDLIAKVYRVEKDADVRGMSHEVRREMRERRSRPILDRLHAWLERTVAKEPPASVLHQACAYSLNHWKALTRFLEDGRLKPDNNGCERQIRSLALGRKNYLFAGSDAGAERAAILYSILRTCALHDVDGYAYLTDVLGKLAEGWPARRLDELLPPNWQANRQATAESATPEMQALPS